MTDSELDRSGCVAFFPDFRMIDDTLWHFCAEECRPVGDSMIRGRLCHAFDLNPLKDASFLDEGVDAVFGILQEHEELMQEFASELEGKLAAGYCIGISIVRWNGCRQWMGRMCDQHLEKFGLVDWGQKYALAAWRRYLDETGREGRQS